MATSSTARRWSSVELIPPLPGRVAAVGWLAAVALAYLALLALASIANAPGLLLSAAAVLIVEALLTREVAVLPWALHRIGLGVGPRWLVRGLAYSVFAARTLPLGVAVLAVAVTVLVAVAVAARVGLAEALRYLRTPAVLTRGLPVPAGVVPPALPAWVAAAGAGSILVELLAPLGLAVSSWRATFAAAVLGLVVTALRAIGPPVLLALHTVAMWRHRTRARVGAAAAQALADYAPEVIVYFANKVEWRYQVEMWLAPVEASGRRAVILARDPQVLRELAPTSLPVVCVPGAATLMALPIASARVALYVGNGADNTYLLRRPELRSVFIGHGDSDKGASANPVSRVYDEIWVAGRAGRGRYARAGIGIAESALVEVGRPQLGVLDRLPDAVPALTVLYAPTWEGWGDDPYATSLAVLGPALVRELLTRPGIRVMYRPHPRTGHRDPAVRAAHDAVVGLLRDAGAAIGPAYVEPEGPSAATGGDPLTSMLASAATAAAAATTATGGGAGWTRATHDAARRAADAQYWAAHPGHRVLTPPAPDLLACFAVTDVLIADVSSVVSDFLAADRPYAVVDSPGQGDAALLAVAPSVAGGFVIGPDLAGLDAVLGATAGDDPSAAARARLRAEILGPRPADPVEPFRAALARSCAAAGRERAAGTP